MVHYAGSIRVPLDTTEAAREQLERMGVTIGKWCTKDLRFEQCQIPVEAMGILKIQPNWTVEAKPTK